MTIADFFQSGFVLHYINKNQLFVNNGGLALTLFIASCVIAAVASYFLGSLNFAIIISGKTYKQDIRNYGSKNAGMTNMMRIYGRKAAGLTLLGDALKAIIACLIGYALLGNLGAYVAGTFSVIGHMFPIYYKFKGGKGVVTAAVTMCMCNPFVFVIIVIIYAIVVGISRYISLGAVMCMLVYPFVLAGVDSWLLPAIQIGDSDPVSGSPYAIFALLIAVLVIYKHKENIKRLRAGTESKFVFKKSVKADKVIQNDKKNTDSESSDDE